MGCPKIMLAVIGMGQQNVYVGLIDVCGGMAQTMQVSLVVSIYFIYRPLICHFTPFYKLSMSPANNSLSLPIINGRPINMYFICECLLYIVVATIIQNVLSFVMKTTTFTCMCVLCTCVCVIGELCIEHRSAPPPECAKV